MLQLKRKFSCNLHGLMKILICGNFHSISFVSVYLRCNRVVLVLVNVAKENEKVNVWLEEYPSFFFSIIILCDSE